MNAKVNSMIFFFNCGDAAAASLCYCYYCCRVDGVAFVQAAAAHRMYSTTHNSVL